ncbi:hypothetical protein PMNALOAF_2780 [Methylobacterium adhaesivum]|uniref:Helix-turn-helix transcriptional regulator n=1 Tax=Methylobacterium adhaesivum TaxID=333297 RepID=A0ABT8BLR6_9HYPH|nr:helix-turn-helix transcriptional regulator [Methylobacterium adhaesivum]MDN3592134.1 helix-turn-helix transcriptional regulator [Methylobacterium adhaesivum]GJD31521.1 hypothetical protein PMNALOAF_2780 [Methylobacterium adhaesivum]
MDAKENAKPLTEIRTRLGWPQVAMAQAMGLSLRAYQALEAGETPIRQIHLLAAERVSMHHACIQGRPEITTGTIRSECLDLAAMIRGTQKKPATANRAGESEDTNAGEAALSV